MPHNFFSCYMQAKYISPKYIVNGPSPETAYWYYSFLWILMILSCFGSPELTQYGNIVKLFPSRFYFDMQSQTCNSSLSYACCAEWHAFRKWEPNYTGKGAFIIYGWGGVGGGGGGGGKSNRWEKITSPPPPPPLSHTKNEWGKNRHLPSPHHGPMTL